eukprot:gene17087-20494_t
MKSLPTLLFMLMLSASVTGQTNTNMLGGKALFENKCIRCHGKDGTKGMFGAKNLQESRLANDVLLRIISDGKSVKAERGSIERKKNKRLSVFAQ